MPTVQVKELRKSGKLTEALEMALQDLANDPENMWNKRSISWVYYDYLKKNAEENDSTAFIENLSRIKALQLSPDDKMLFDNLVWPITKILRDLTKEKQKAFHQLNIIFEEIKELHFTKPSKEFSILFGVLHKAFKDTSKYFEVIDWCGLDNLRPEDYLSEEFNNRKIMAVAEQVFTAYAKKLSEGTPLDQFGTQRQIDKDAIHDFLPKLDQVIEDQPDYQYPSYFKVKMLMALGETEDVFSVFLPFAKQKKNDFWVWQLMSEIYKDDPEIIFNCLCKALSLSTPEEFLVKIRQRFAKILIERKMFSEAKTEINRIINLKEQKESSIPGELQQWILQPWFSEIEAQKNNLPLYQNHSSLAEELLFQDEVEETIVVSFVNSDKKMLNFIQSKTKQGFFKYDKFINDPQKGDILKVRYQGEPQDDFYRIATLKYSENEVCEMVRIIAGNIKIIPSGIGFLEDCFIDKNLIEYNGILDGQAIKAKALLSFNKKKNDWGWLAYKLKKAN